MLTVYFEKPSKIPMYRQLYQHIKKAIESGGLSAGEKMPSKRKLSAHLRISQITVDAAYQQLVVEGYLLAKPKSGYYVESYDSGFLLKKSPKKPDLSKKIPPVLAYLYDFQTNVVDFRLFPNTTWAKLAREVLAENNASVMNQNDHQGLDRLRQSIAEYLYRFRGIDCQPEQIVIGGGSESLLDLIVPLLGRSAHYAIEDPGYRRIKDILKSQDVNINYVGLDEQGIKIHELTESRANIVHVTPSHQFPMGIVMPMKRRMELLAWASEGTDRFILEDDYDSEFRFVGQPIPALQSLDRFGKVIYINSFSKSLAPSLRINYMVLPWELLKKYRELLSFHVCSVPNFEQYTLYKFMDGGYFERHLNRMRNVYKSRLDVLIRALEKVGLTGFVNVKGSESGLHFLLEVRNGLSEAELLNRAKDHGVRVHGLSEYYFETQKQVPEGTVVIGYSALSEEDIEKAVVLLSNAWKTPESMPKNNC
jgi:GntR family transcriptional regulator/MocR family aminotransferase